MPEVKVLLQGKAKNQSIIYRKILQDLIKLLLKIMLSSKSNHYFSRTSSCPGHTPADNFDIRIFLNNFHN